MKVSNVRGGGSALRIARNAIVVTDSEMWLHWCAGTANEAPYQLRRPRTLSKYLCAGRFNELQVRSTGGDCVAVAKAMRRLLLRMTGREVTRLLSWGRYAIAPSRPNCRPSEIRNEEAVVSGL